MSGHADHGDEKTQAERDLEVKERNRRLDALRDASMGLDAAQEAIPVIAAIRHLYGIGLKEALDLHNGILKITGRTPYNRAGETWEVVAKTDLSAIRSERDLLLRVNRELRETNQGLSARVAAFEKLERVRGIDAQLDDLNEQEKLIRERRESLYRDRDALTGDDTYPDDLDLRDEPF